MEAGRLYKSVGTGVSTLETDAGNVVDAVCLIFPRAFEEQGAGPDGAFTEEQCDELHLTVPATKALLIDLRDALEFVEDQHRKGKQ